MLAAPLDVALDNRARRGDSPSMGSLRICHVVLSMDVGGLERLVVALARDAVQREHEVIVVCLEKRGTLASELERLGVRVVCLNKRAGVRLSLVWQLRKVLKRFNPSVVHTHQIGALLYSGFATSLCRDIVLVHTEHGKHYELSRRKRVVGRLASTFTTRFFCVSKDIAAAVEARRVAARSKISVIPNGIAVSQTASVASDTESRLLVRQQLGIPAHAFVIGTVGRLAEIKRQDLLLRAFAQFRQDGKSAHLLIVGEGSKRSELESLAAQLDVTHTVHFVGYQADPVRYLAAMDVFCLTSQSEGMPLTVLEAWAAGIPVACFGVGGLPDLITHESTGLLVPFGHVEALSEVWHRVCSNRDLANRLVSVGYDEVQSKYDLSCVCASYLDEYHSLTRNTCSSTHIPS